jgi:ABC-type nickel/cobalt efflux system permease component RcnA
VNFEILYRPLEHADGSLQGLLAGSPLLIGLLVAFVLGLRHASDPDHLVAVTSLIAAEDGDVKSGMRLGAWWGIGHGLALIGIGAPLIMLKSSVPEWLEAGAEKAVALVIVLLAVRVLWKWARGDYRISPHHHAGDAHRHWHEEARGHRHVRVRTWAQALLIGLLHGLGGTGAVVVLLIAGMPGRMQALAALAVFAPMSMVSMTLCTGAYAWVLTRGWVQPLYRRVLIPAMGAFGVLFGTWYAGLG